MPTDARLQERVTSALADRYEVEREIGQGATATVFSARDTRYDRRVAIKVLHKDLASGLSGERFQREIKFAAGLQHPHILTVFDSGETQGLLYYTMPLVDGESLRDRLARDHTMPVADVVRIARELADGLAYAHSRGVVHRDLKPANILLTADHAFIVDFGVARAVEPSDAGRLTMTGASIGTPVYMSPEQAAGEPNIDPRSDIYSLACIVYEMLTGVPPFLGATVQGTLAQHVQGRVPSARAKRPDVPVAVDAAIRKALAKNPADRFASAAEFADALGQTSLPVRLPRPRVLAAIAAAVVLVSAGVWGAKRVHFTSGTTLDQHLVAVAPFDVAPELVGWRQGLLDMLARNLDGAGPLRVLPTAVATSAWSGQPDVASAVAFGRNKGASISVVGAVYRTSPDSARLTASIVDVDQGRSIGDIQIVVPTARLDYAADSVSLQVLEVLSRAKRVGAIRIGAHVPPIPALKAYLRGEEFYRRTVWDSAQAELERAVELSPDFALALHRLFIVRSWEGTGIDSVVQQYALRAAGAEHGVSPRDSIVLTADSLHASIQSARDHGEPTPLAATKRLLAMLEKATREYPTDADLWAYYAFSLKYDMGIGKADRRFEAWDHVIALDSGYAPAFYHTIEDGTSLRGVEDGLRRMRAYLATNPGGSFAQAIRLVLKLRGVGRSDSTTTDVLLRRSPVQVLFPAFSITFWWTDSAEVAVRIAHQLNVRKSETRVLSQDPNFGRDLELLASGARGQIRRALDVAYSASQPYPPYVQELAVLGKTDVDSVTRITNREIPVATAPLAGVMTILGWLAYVGDTAALRVSARRATVALAGQLSGDAAADARFVLETALGYLSLLRRDTSEAIRHLVIEPDSICPICHLSRFTKSLVLEARGRLSEASLLLDVSTVGNFHPLSVRMRLERARIAERLGDLPRAASEYQRVADAWALADSALRPLVAEARDGMVRAMKKR